MAKLYLIPYKYQSKPYEDFWYTILDDPHKPICLLKLCGKEFDC